MSTFRLHTPNASYTLSDLLQTSDEKFQHDFLAVEIAIHIREWMSGKTTFDLQTSGSTGPPKNITVDRSQIEASAISTLAFFNLVPGSVVVCPLNLAVIGGKMMVYRSLIGSLQLHIIPADKMLSQLNMQETYDFMPISAIQLYEILQHDAEKTNFLNSIKNILIGGSSISEQLLKSIHEKLNCTVWHSYGMTETVSHVAMRQVHPLEEECYTLLDTIEAKVDERSCLAIKGGVTNNLWLQTNDVVECINNRQFYFKGRSDFTINSGGIKVQVETIEKNIDKVFTELNILIPFFIAGIPDAALGEKIVLVLESLYFSNESTSKMQTAFKERLPKYHVPKEILSATFIYTPSGKINRIETLKKIVHGV